MYKHNSAYDIDYLRILLVDGSTCMYIVAYVKSVGGANCLKLCQWMKVQIC